MTNEYFAARRAALAEAGMPFSVEINPQPTPKTDTPIDSERLCAALEKDRIAASRLMSETNATTAPAKVTNLPEGASYANDAKFLLSLGFTIGLVNADNELIPMKNDWGQRVYWTKSNLPMKIALAVADQTFAGLAIDCSDSVIVEGPRDWPGVRVLPVFTETLSRDLGNDLCKRVYEVPLHMRQSPPRKIQWGEYTLTIGRSHEPVNNGGWQFRKLGVVSQMASCPTEIRNALEGI